MERLTESIIEQSLATHKCVRCDYTTHTAGRCPLDGSVLYPVLDDELLGTTISGCYQVIEKVGEGGWSVVYRAVHLQLGRTVAIKIGRRQITSQPDHLKRFEREVSALCSLFHSNLTTVFHYGILPDGRPYIVLEYVEGCSLSSLIQSNQDLDRADALNIMIGAAEALVHVHKNGLLHRDVKPSNILVASNRNAPLAKLVDFGLAKLIGADRDCLTKTGEAIGTPAYMSPEQGLGEEVDTRSDVYSFGCVLYEIFTGQKPFSGKSALDVMQKHLYEVPQSFAARGTVSLPPELERLTLSCLAKRPDDRVGSMDEILAELKRIQSHCNLVGSDARTTPIQKVPMGAQTSNAQSFQKLLFPLVFVLMVLGLFIFQTLAGNGRGWGMKTDRHQAIQKNVELPYAITKILGQKIQWETILVAGRELSVPAGSPITKDAAVLDKLATANAPPGEPPYARPNALAYDFLNKRVFVLGTGFYPFNQLRVFDLSTSRWSALRSFQNKGNIEGLVFCPEDGTLYSLATEITHAKPQTVHLLQFNCAGSIIRDTVLDSPARLAPFGVPRRVLDLRGNELLWNQEDGTYTCDISPFILHKYSKP